MFHWYLRAYFYRFLLCMIISVCKFMGISRICCISVFTVILVWIYIFTDVFICLCFIYNASARVLCVCISIACSSKNLCDIAQLDVGYVTICSIERVKAFSHVSWPNLGGRGCYTYCWVLGIYPPQQNWC